MTRFPVRLATLLLLGLGAAAGAGAESLASSASSAGSASVGSLSDSVKGSSNSSSGKTQVAEGAYRVIDVAAAPDRDQALRITLQATDRPGPEGALQLELPRRAWEPQGLRAGDLVQASHRPYGVEFARADTRTPFFLALADDWRHELDTRAVGL